jgi:ubiquinone/menaquinone biosynthesis C-methylase UbiE
MKQKSYPSKEKIAQSYNQVYAEDPYLSDIDSLYEWVLSKLNPGDDDKIVDIACGRGKLSDIGARHGLGIYGIDISLFAIRSKIQQSDGNAYFCVGDGEKLPYAAESFTFATNIGSLEHFLDMDLGLSEMVRILKPGGTAAILLPNSYYLIDIIWKVWRTGWPPSHRQVVERFFTFNEWKSFIEANGLHVIKTLKYNRFLPKNKNELGWYLKFPNRLVEAILGLIIPRNLSYHFLFLCQK